MNKIKKIALLVFVLPVSLLFDFIIFSLTRNCATCGSFSQFISNGAALSFPLIVLLGDWINKILIDLKIHKQ